MNIRDTCSQPSIMQHLLRMELPDPHVKERLPSNLRYLPLARKQDQNACLNLLLSDEMADDVSECLSNDFDIFPSFDFYIDWELPTDEGGEFFAGARTVFVDNQPILEHDQPFTSPLQDLPHQTAGESLPPQSRSVDESTRAHQSPRSTTSPGNLSRVTSEEDKCYRNALASRRFRNKKKLREKILERDHKVLCERIEKLQIRLNELEVENKWLRTLVIQKQNANNNHRSINHHHAPQFTLNLPMRKDNIIKFVSL
jgi:hypothetical protein